MTKYWVELFIFFIRSESISISSHNSFTLDKLTIDIAQLLLQQIIVIVHFQSQCYLSRI